MRLHFKFSFRMLGLVTEPVLFANYITGTATLGSRWLAVGRPLGHDFVSPRCGLHRHNCMAAVSL